MKTGVAGVGVGSVAELKTERNGQKAENETDGQTNESDESLGEESGKREWQKREKPWMKESQRGRDRAPRPGIRIKQGVAREMKRERERGRYRRWGRER